MQSHLWEHMPLSRHERAEGTAGAQLHHDMCLCPEARKERQKRRWGGLPRARSRGTDGAIGKGPRGAQGGFRSIRWGQRGTTGQTLAGRAGRKEGSIMGHRPPAEKGQVQQGSPQINAIGSRRSGPSTTHPLQKEKGGHDS